MNKKELRRVAEQYPTPFYVFDERELARKIKSIQDTLPPKTKLCYAMKANPFITLAASNLVERIEVCSPGELEICQTIGIDPAKIVLSGVAKDPALMSNLIKTNAGIACFTVESMNQFNMLERIARDTNARIRVLMRLSSKNQFGMDEPEIMEVLLKHRASRFVSFRGIQFFSGTQKNSSRRIEREIEKLDRFICDIERECGVGILELEYGPGFPVEYFEPDATAAHDIEFTPIATLSESITNMRFKRTVVLELGRSIAASCGTYVTTIVDTKRVGKQNFAIVDGGMHQITYYGPAMAMKQPVCETLAPHHETNLEPWNICGSLCTTSDILAKQIMLPQPNIGDMLAFHKAGAYCATEGIALFLSRDLPRIVLCDAANKLHLVRSNIETAQFNCPQLFRESR